MTGLPGTDQLSAAASQLLNTLSRKGIVPTVRIATVGGSTGQWLPPVEATGAQSSLVLVTFDGDTVSTFVNTVIGAVQQGDRVVVISFPYGVNYIIGRANIAKAGWQTVTPNTWSVSQPLRFSFINNRTDMVFVTGILTPVGSKTDGTAIATTPTGYEPIRSQDIPVSTDATVSGGQSPHVNIATNGIMVCYGCGNANGVSFNAFYVRV